MFGSYILEVFNTMPMMLDPNQWKKIGGFWIPVLQFTIMSYRNTFFTQKILDDFMLSGARIHP